MLGSARLLHQCPNRRHRPETEVRDGHIAARWARQTCSAMRRRVEGSQLLGNKPRNVRSQEQAVPQGPHGHAEHESAKHRCMAAGDALMEFMVAVTQPHRPPTAPRQRHQRSVTARRPQPGVVMGGTERHHKAHTQLQCAGGPVMLTSQHTAHTDCSAVSAGSFF